MSKFSGNTYMIAKINFEITVSIILVSLLRNKQDSELTARTQNKFLFKKDPDLIDLHIYHRVFNRLWHTAL